jgi:hypothetical protein
VGLRGELRGAFIDFDGKELFVGSYAKDEAGSKGHFLPLSIFETQAGKTIDATAATRFIALPLESQGAAFDRDGALWVTASNSRMGMLHRLSSQTGEIAASYEMVIGIEDIGFDASGQLWSVSEAGSLRWRKWSKVFPVISRIDVSRLKAK